MKRGLGKGLEELLAIYDTETPTPQPTNPRPEKAYVEPVNSVDRYTQSQGDVTKLDINLIYPNPNQPRKNFDKESLEEM